MRTQIVNGSVGRYVPCMIRWNIRQLMDAKGWKNPNHLAMGARLTYPVARRVWRSVTNGDAIDRLDAETLEKLRVAFGLRGAPWSLLEYIPDPKAKVGR